MLSSTPNIDSDDASELEELTERLLWRARVERQFPTPIEKIVVAAGVRPLVDVERARLEYLSLASARTQEDLQSAWRKMVGLADIETASLYVSPTQQERLRRKATLHEVAHLIIPWHNTRPRHEDDAHTLSPACRDRLDVEANAVANELLFQGNHFRALAGGMRPDIDGITRLADLYGAPLDDTARMFSLTLRQPLLVLAYRHTLVGGRPGLSHEVTIGSAYEGAEFNDLAIPEAIGHEHRWFRAQGFQLFNEELVVDHGFCRRFECGVVRRGDRVWVSMRPVATRVHLIRSVHGTRPFATTS